MTLKNLKTLDRIKFSLSPRYV